MRELLRMSVVLVFGVCLTLVLGCGSGSEEKPVKVTGTVTLDGKAIPNGEILFEPSNDRPGGSAEIKDGKYELETTPGENTVRISARVEFGEPDATGVKNSRETVPPKYNEESTLKKKVAAEGDNKFDFQLKSR